MSKQLRNTMQPEDELLPPDCRLIWVYFPNMWWDICDATHLDELQNKQCIYLNHTFSVSKNRSKSTREAAVLLNEPGITLLRAGCRVKLEVNMQRSLSALLSFFSTESIFSVLVKSLNQSHRRQSMQHAVWMMEYCSRRLPYIRYWLMWCLAHWSSYSVWWMQQHTVTVCPQTSSSLCILMLYITSAEQKLYYLMPTS